MEDELLFPASNVFAITESSKECTFIKKFTIMIIRSHALSVDQGDTGVVTTTATTLSSGAIQALILNTITTTRAHCLSPINHYGLTVSSKSLAVSLPPVLAPLPCYLLGAKFAQFMVAFTFAISYSDAVMIFTKMNSIPDNRWPLMWTRSGLLSPTYLESAMKPQSPSIIPALLTDIRSPPASQSLVAYCNVFTMVIDANSDPRTIIRNTLDPAIVARRLRIYPYSARVQQQICLRFALYGCEFKGKCLFSGRYKAIRFSAPRPLVYRLIVQAR
ncbi:unnamed protein product [Dibothriocephalus latus]|uniref:Uncharacterized protein n=1 Tax=Dibothriocephalus latus TaxID=60516 RepID=A0A3P7LEX6_DIBLA|nr:unnamed protein product [Dibothriocephalus latus]